MIKIRKMFVHIIDLTVRNIITILDNMILGERWKSNGEYAYIYIYMCIFLLIHSQDKN